MERPAKRLRIGLAAYNDKEDDELGLEPEEFEQLELSKDPGYQLEQGRAKAAYKLKSTFEHIFEKYERDFTDVGDEINLRTGEIVVDNGHLQSMHDARDDASQAGRTEDAHSEADSTEEEERILHGGRIGPDGSSSALIPRPLDYNAGQVPRLSSLMDGSSRLSGMMPFSRMPFAPFTPPRSFASFAIPSDPIESPWRAPELPSSAFSAAFKPQGLLGRGTHGAPRTVVRKALPRPQIVVERQNGDAEDDDEILLGVSGNALKRKGLPAPEGAKDSMQAVGNDLQSPQQAVSSPQSEALEPATPGSNSVRVKKTVQSMRPPDPPPKARRSRKRATVTNANQQKDKDVIIVQESKQSNDKDGSTKQASAKRRRSPHALSSPRPVVVVTSRKHRAGSLAQGTAVVTARRSPRERKQIEFYRNSDWGKRGDPKERSLYVELSAKGIDTRAYSKVNVPATPGKFASQPVMVGFVEELGSREQSPAGQETIPIDDPLLADAEANALNNEPTEKQNPEVAPETFSRNIVDPSYAFSDEEDDLPRRKDTIHKQTVEKAVFPMPAPPITKDAVVAIAEEQEIMVEESSTVATAPKRVRRRKSSANIDIIRAGSIELGEERDEPLGSDGLAPVDLPEADSLPQPRTAKPRRSSTQAKFSKASSVLAPSQGIVADPEHSSIQPAGSPHTPKHKKPPIEKPTPQPSSAARTGIMSLLSDDDDEDELSFSTEDLTSSDARRRSFVLHRSSPSSRQPASTPRRASRHRSLLVSSHGKARTPRSAGRLSMLGSSGGRYSLPRGVVRLRGSRVSSPSSALVRTPGGTMRRCGEDGFRCDRDFCFTCM